MTQPTAKQELESFGYQQQLKRSLSLWQLTAFGLNYMIPIAPAIIFGFVLIASGGTVALPYLIAGVGMSFTALSYGIFLKRFPMAGSLYSYVSRGFNPHVGFVAGWVLLLDYVLIPTVTSMSAVLYFQQFIPTISYKILLLIFVLSTGLLNLFGVELMASLGLWLLIFGEIVIFTGFCVWSYAVSIKGIGVGHLLSLEPFKFHSFTTLATATSIATLSYLGFDAITTLTEEAINPKRDIPKAILLSVMIGGLTMFLTGYLGMLTIPNWQQFAGDQNWLGTTLFYVAKISGGNWFALFYTAGFIIAMAVFNIVATAAGARLLFGMGRDEVLPKKIFGAIHARWKTPYWNIILITCLEYIIGIAFTVDTITELVNYGALFGFILLNFSVIWLHFIKDKKANNAGITRLVNHLFSPIFGMIILIWVFINMKPITLLVGTAWLIIGIVIGCWQSKGYRKLPPAIKA